MAAKRYPIILVPGAMASELYLDKDRIWPPDELTDFAKLRHLKGGALRVGGLVRRAQPIPKIGLGRIDLWESFVGGFLSGELGYRENVDLFIFSYDWRQDIRLSARKLSEAVRGFAKTVHETQAIPENTPVKFYLIGHSLGSLVCRWFVDQEQGREVIARMLLLGPVDRGAPSSFIHLASGQYQAGPQAQPVLSLMWDHVLPAVLGGTTDILRSVQPLFQTIPDTPFVFGPEGPIDVFADTSWLGSGEGSDRDDWLAYLEQARTVQQAMAKPSTVPTTYIYGLGSDTPKTVDILPGNGGYDWAHMRINWGQGDGLVLSRSAWPGDLQAGVQVEWVEAKHSALHHTEEARVILRNEIRIPQSLEVAAPVVGLLPEDVRSYLQAIVEDDRFISASQADKGQQVIPLPADPERPVENVKAVIASAQPGKPVVIMGRTGAGKTEALYSVMWHLAKSGLEPDGELLLPIYVDLRRYRSEVKLMTLVWSALAETGAKTFITEQVQTLLAKTQCLVLLDDLDRLLERRGEAGLEDIQDFIQKNPNVRVVLAADSAGYHGEIWGARQFILLSRALEQAVGSMPQQVGDVIVAIIGDNASNIAIGREASVHSIRTTEEAAKATTANGLPQLNYKQLAELMTAAQNQDWEKVEAIANDMSKTFEK